MGDVLRGDQGFEETVAYMHDVLVKQGPFDVSCCNDGLHS